MGALFRQQAVDHQAKRLFGEVLLTQPMRLRVTSYLLGSSVLLLGLWLWMGQYARVETAQGLLVTDISAPKIFAPVPGVVSALDVSDGQIVRKGQRLATIHLDRRQTDGGEAVPATIAAIESRIRLHGEKVAIAARRAEKEKERLSEIGAGALATSGKIESEIELQRSVVASNAALFERLKPAMERGFVSRVEFEQKRQAVLNSEQGLRSLEQQAISARTQAAQARVQFSQMDGEREREVNDAKSTIGELAQERAQLRSSEDYVITAPVSGRVTAFQTGVGRAALPNSPLMIIVPTDAQLRADVYAPSRAIGFLRPGQEARLLYDAFPYDRFGSFRGTIAEVSGAVTDPRDVDIPVRLEEPGYRVTIRLDKQWVTAFGGRVPLQPGMAVRANIVLEKQTFLAWLLSPLRAVLSRSS